MSKYELQDRAFKASGVTYEDSLQINSLQPSLYERIGKEDGCLELSQTFYNRVFNDSEIWFLNIFSSSTKQEAIDHQYRFFVQTFGGPDLYRQKKGKYTRLVGRHANYNISRRSADRWVMHMTHALQEHSCLANDQIALKALQQYFQYTAQYIVAASEYMRPDQLSGGTQIDEGRIW